MAASASESQNFGEQPKQPNNRNQVPAPPTFSSPAARAGTTYGLHSHVHPGRGSPLPGRAFQDQRSNLVRAISDNQPLQDGFHGLMERSISEGSNEAPKDGANATEGIEVSSLPLSNGSLEESDLRKYGSFPAETASLPSVSTSDGVPLSRLPGPPSFASPLRPSFSPVQLTPPPPPPSFSPPPPPNFATPSPRQGAPFSEIPISPAKEYPRERTLSEYLAADREQYQHYDSRSSSTAASHVLFSSQLVLREKKLMNTASLGFGALVSLGRGMSPGPPTVRRNPFRCQTCGAYPNLFCSIVANSGQWKCIFCDTINSSDGEYRAASKDDLHNWIELVTSVVDYVDAATWRPGFVPVADSTMAAPVIIVIDDCLDEPHLQHLQSSLHSFLDSLPQSTRVGILSYGKTVSVYDLSESGLAAADVLPGDVSASQEILKMLLYGTGVYLAPIHACISIVQTIVSSLRPYGGDLPEAARQRCLGTAVGAALALIQGPSTDLPRSMVKRSGGSSRVLVCVGGPSTYGPGSVPSYTHPNYAYLEAKAFKFMEHLGQEARHLDTAVDLFCAGTCPVNVSILQPLVKASGGVLVLHDDFGETFGLNLQRAVQRATGFRGTIELRCSEQISLAQVIGPGEDLGSDGSETFKKEPAVALKMLSVEESQGFAFLMKLREDLPGEHAYFQFSAQYTNIYQANVTRVVTIRLPITDDVKIYLQSVDDEVAALLIAKKVVLEAKSASDANDMRLSIDERVKDIAAKFGTRVNQWRFPSELSRLPEILFHLRRGPLLGNIIGHEDERGVLRNLFLQASYDLASRMLLPRVLMHHKDEAFEEVPAYDLAMQSDTALVLDHGTDIFIWVGFEVSQDEARNAIVFAACKVLTQELSEMRFPAPRMLTFKEASSQARYLQARLIPAHKDPPFEQVTRFPQLKSLNPEQRSALKVKFLQTDDLSFCEWMRKLKLILPEPR